MIWNVVEIEAILAHMKRVQKALKVCIIYYILNLWMPNEYVGTSSDLQPVLNASSSIRSGQMVAEFEVIAIIFKRIICADGDKCKAIDQ